MSVVTGKGVIEPEHPASSLLIVEIRERAITGVLSDVVAGRHRLVAAWREWTAQGERSMAAAFDRMVMEIERIVGRRLMDSSGLIRPEMADGQGCDAIIVTAGPPLRIASIPLSRTAVEAVLGAAEPAVWFSDSIYPLDSLLDQQGGLVTTLASVLRDRRPDVLLLAGDDDSATAAGDLLSLAAAIAAAGQLCRDPLPLVVAAMSPALRSRFVAALDQAAQRMLAPGALRIREGELAGLRTCLRDVWQERLTEQFPFAATGRPSPVPAPWLEGLGRAAHILSAWSEAPVWIADVEGELAVVVRAIGDDVALSLGCRHDLESLSVRTAGPGGAAERDRRPWLIQDDAAGITAERDALIRLLASAAAGIPPMGKRDQQPGLIVGRGFDLIARLPTEVAASAIGLGLGLTGACTVALDRHYLLAGAGALLDIQPDAAADLLYDALDPLGGVMIVRAARPPEDRTARLRIDTAHGETIEVGWEEPVVLSGDAWERRDLRLTPPRRVDLGNGEGKRVDLALEGGELGLVVAAGDRSTARRWARSSGLQVRVGSVVRRGP